MTRAWGRVGVGSCRSWHQGQVTVAARSSWNAAEVAGLADSQRQAVPAGLYSTGAYDTFTLLQPGFAATFRCGCNRTVIPVPVLPPGTGAGGHTPLAASKRNATRWKTRPAESLPLPEAEEVRVIFPVGQVQAPPQGQSESLPWGSETDSGRPGTRAQGRSRVGEAYLVAPSP